MLRPHLVLMRHAKSAYPEGVPDHDRPLNERGQRDARKALDWFAHTGSQFLGTEPAVLVSTALRAQQTWQQVRSSLPNASIQQAPHVYEAAISTLINLSAPSIDNGQSALVIGHNPGLGGLADFLGDPQESVESWRVREKYPTCAIVVLEFKDDSWSMNSARVTDFVVPRA
jgi:phosphohistidine phosphatase